METTFLILVIILFLLAASDLVVGVSNDAVNFLNSAIGAKAAPFKWIMIIAGAGVVVGASFSNGMMEVARKGIMNPDQFYFSEIMFIFLAVMITDVILLDTFNTFGLPTSTTVSIVFELLGASVAMGLFKIFSSEETRTLLDFINSSKALAIISGILLSVVIAFAVGAIVQYIARLVFTFQYKKRLKYFGSLYGGIALASITYFILVKGIKGSTFFTEETASFIAGNSMVIFLLSLVGWTIIFQLLYWFTRVNIPKIVVLVGTFSLAMAFAGNDLVNFIGVPLAGYESFREFVSQPGANPGLLTMDSLKEPVRTNPLFLIGAGLIMVATLWTSRKARSVVQTTLDLSRQDEGDERFSSNALSRAVVGFAISINQFYLKLMPLRLQERLSNAFVQRDDDEERNNTFDMIRASINLVVASILIASATSLTLPLSTTYVTFMVAMGTSLSDRAWGRESAVYRITGVFSVIGGWFLTAIAAFVVSGIVATSFALGGNLMVFIMVVAAGIMVFRTHVYHKSKESSKNEDLIALSEINEKNIFNNAIQTSQRAFEVYRESLLSAINGIVDYDLKTLKEANKSVQHQTKIISGLKSHINQIIHKLDISALENAHYYIQVLDYLREIGHSLGYITKPCLKHVANRHKPLDGKQIKELKELQQMLIGMMDEVCSGLMDEERKIDSESISNARNNLHQKVDAFRKKQVHRIKAKTSGSRNSLLYLGILNEAIILAIFIHNFYQAREEFASFRSSKA